MPPLYFSLIKTHRVSGVYSSWCYVTDQRRQIRGFKKCIIFKYISHVSAVEN